MQKIGTIVTITTQGQLTIPKVLRDAFGIKRSTKAFVRRVGNTIIVEPKKDFWALKGSLRSQVLLSDQELRNARAEFSRSWPRKRK